MTAMHRATHTLIGVLALLAVLAAPAGAQVGKLLDPNAAPESELAQLPFMTPAIVKAMMEQRPFKTVLELNKLLLDNKLTTAQAREFYRKAFVPINANTGAREELLLIPGVGARMATELAEYRPWKTWAQFDKEIGKYVGQPETDRLKQYVFIPPS
jgi:DNA uptake protein ComE-like DNA-binding protein